MAQETEHSPPSRQQACVLPDYEDLPPQDIERYSRQLLITNGFGVSGQQRLLSSSVLIVGAGGIGCGVLPYLAGAGVGKIGIIDNDTVEVSNLHRQVLHRTVQQNKAESLCHFVQCLNPSIDCIAYPTSLDASNALKMVEQYDIVVDASDNPRTRYTLNDACILARTPLVSGSAVGTQGAITVIQSGSPCYRCLYPKPNLLQAACASCSDAGVLGPVPGLIGVLQSIEAIKLLTTWGTPLTQSQLLVDVAGDTSFMKLKKPPRRADCRVCGNNPTIQSMEDSARDLDGIRGPANGVAALDEGVPSISVQEYRAIRQAQTPHTLLDVRVREQYDLCRLAPSVSLPLGEIEQLDDATTPQQPIYVICRRGVASVEATRRLLDRGIPCTNVRGGLQAWHEQVDASFPKY